jgi:hypothetical protein
MSQDQINNSTLSEINHYLNSIDDGKKEDILLLHQFIQDCLTVTELSFHSGLNEEQKIVSNPIIGYGSYQHRFAKGKIAPMFQIGLTANTNGISIHIMGIRQKLDLPNLISPQIGKANVSSYCIQFKRVQDINLDVLKTAIVKGVEVSKQ